MSTNTLTKDQLTFDDIVELLGGDADNLLGFNSPKISKFLP